MKLKITARTGETKNDAKKLRRSGLIPAIIYSEGKEGRMIAVSNQELLHHLAHLPKGRLSTTKFTLTDDDGKESIAIIKDIQYDITRYDMIHLDFEELKDNIEVNVSIPIECTGIVECAGVKLGGILRQIKRTLKVRCLPKDIPNVFIIDVTNLGIKENRRLADISLPNGVKPLDNLSEIAVAVMKR